jgi:hypothetical protein
VAGAPRHDGTTGIVTFVGGGTAAISLDSTGLSGDTAEFFGIFRNDMPQITRIQLDASGDGSWAIDMIEYGLIPVSVEGRAWGSIKALYE